MKPLVKFYAGSAELDRMDSALKLALGVLTGLFDSQSYEIFGSGPPSIGFRTSGGPSSVSPFPHRFDPILVRLKDGIRWQINCTVEKSRIHSVSITCHSGKDELYPSRGIGRIEGVRRAYESFDRFYSAVLRRYPFVAEYVEAMEALASAA